MIEFRMPREIRSNHVYAYRSGQWAEITGISTIDIVGGEKRDVYVVRFTEDGAVDNWAVKDHAACYEFRGGEWARQISETWDARGLHVRTMQFADGHTETWLPDIRMQQRVVEEDMWCMEQCDNCEPWYRHIIKPLCSEGAAISEGVADMLVTREMKIYELEAPYMKVEMSRSAHFVNVSGPGSGVFPEYGPVGCRRWCDYASMPKNVLLYIKKLREEIYELGRGGDVADRLREREKAREIERLEEEVRACAAVLEKSRNGEKQAECELEDAKLALELAQPQVEWSNTRGHGWTRKPRFVADMALKLIEGFEGSQNYEHRDILVTVTSSAGEWRYRRAQ